MEGDYKKEGTVDLLEDCWFFGNLLNTKAKILRCNSDPSPSSKEEEMFELKKNTSKPNNLLRSPSLPPNLDKEEEDLDEEDGPRMGDLIRQAMPCKLARTPSLPPYMIKIKKEVSSPQDVMMPKGPTMTKLTRRSSLDPSLLLPPKHTSKGMRSNFSAPSTSKNLQQRRSGKNMKPGNLERSMSLKTLSDVEVQGFQDLGFKFDKDDLSPSVVNKLAGLQIKEEVDDEEEKRNPTLSEAWNATQTTKQWSYSPPIPKWIDTKSSAEDMKAQIKFWARSIASNVHQEC